MKLLEVLEKVYKRKKNGELTYHAINFCKKNNLDIDKDYSTRELILAFSTLSSKEKRIMALDIITKEDKPVRNIGINLLEIRKMSYKESCRVYHPDNILTGNNGIFQFLQEVKCAFWHCDGRPKDKIRYFDWDEEKSIMKSAKDGKFF